MSSRLLLLFFYSNQKKVFLDLHNFSSFKTSSIHLQDVLGTKKMFDGYAKGLKSLQKWNETFTAKNSHRRCSVRKGVLRNFVKLTGIHLCQSFFFNKVASLRCFPVSFAKFLKTPFHRTALGDCFYVSLKPDEYKKTFHI